MIDVARVFFLYENANHPESADHRVPSRILLQRLENHTGNVAKLVQLWQREAKDTDLVLHPSTEKQVIEAARLHDVGKPQRFRILAKTHKNNRGVEVFKDYEYSFSGHRFLAESKDRYIQELAQGHHTYSVQDINDAITRLRRKDKDSHVGWFAQDLYILEMCDQIEAEIAVRTLEGNAEGRTFMEFTIIPGDGSTYRVDPYPFKQDEIELTLEYYELILSTQQRKELRELKPEESQKIARTLEKYIKDVPEGGKQDAQQVSVRIRPLIPEVQLPSNFRNCEYLYREIGDFIPNQIQRDLFDNLAQGEDALLLRAPTGSGKTEAVLIPSLASGKRLILPLPTRSLLEDHERRIKKYLEKFSALPENKDRPVALIIDTGEASRRRVFINGRILEFKFGNQIQDYQHRHLYKADVILTTFDKFLYRYFGFGDAHKSFIYPLRIRDEARTLICFDEAHTYDGVSFINFRRLVRALYESGQGVVVMTATMPDAYKEEINFLQDLNYTDALAAPKRGLTIIESKYEDLSDALVEQIVRLWERGIQKVIVIAESVGFCTEIEDKQRRTLRDGAFNVYTKLKQLVIDHKLSNLIPRENLLLYHGRMDSIERAQIYQKLKKLDDDMEAKYILVTTSAIEVGCDLNAEALITEICNPEQLIQRAGRCNRRANYDDAEVIVVLPKEPYPNSGWIKPYTRSLNLSEEAQYIQFLKQESGHLLNPKTLVEKVAKRPANDYRVETLFEMLDEYVYGARLENKPIHDRGFIVTRSWEPTLSFKIRYNDKDQIISVPFSMCACSKGEKPEPSALVQQVYYNHDSNRESLGNVSGGPIYGKQIVVKLASTFEYNPEYGLVDVPKVFTWKRTFNYKIIMQATKEDGSQGSIIWYFRDLPDDGYFTGYIKEIVAEETGEGDEEGEED
jgi:CRISPR-associated endonuclease/helicase Cas3